MSCVLRARGHSTQLAVRANVELLRQLAERPDANGNFAHPDIGKVGIVDGSLLHAHLPQHMPNGPAEREAMLNDRWQKVGDIVYTDSRARAVLGLQLIVNVCPSPGCRRHARVGSAR